MGEVSDSNGAADPGVSFGRYETPVQLGDYLPINARRAPDQACIRLGDGTTFSFAEVNRRVNQLVRALQALGFNKGDRLAVIATDRHQYLETVLACTKAGFVYLPINYRLAPPEMELLLKDSEPQALFVSEEYARLVSDLSAAVPSIRLAVGYDGGGDGIVAHEDLISGQPGDDVPVVATDQDLIAIAYTSGTTGLPKGVMQSQGMLRTMILSALPDQRVQSSDFRYSAAPLFHISGIVLPLIGVVYGFPSLLLRQFDAAAVLWWMREGGLTVVFMVPTMITMVLDQPDAAGRPYPQLRYILYGAAPMPPALLKRAMSIFDCGFIGLFGAGTEAGCQAVLTPEDHEAALAGREHLLESVGKPPYFVDLRLCDPERADLVDVAPGAVGEIVTRSNMVMSGYYRRPDESARVYIDGWFRGGDLARMDEDGYLYLAGRSKDMIIRGGENVYPIEIESVLYELAGVREAAVVGVPDDRWGEAVCAVLEVGDQRPDLATVQAFCRQRLASYKVPAYVEYRDQLPKNASGKILKRVLRDELAAELANSR